MSGKCDYSNLKSAGNMQHGLLFEGFFYWILEFKDIFPAVAQSVYININNIPECDIWYIYIGIVNCVFKRFCQELNLRDLSRIKSALTLPIMCL